MTLYCVPVLFCVDNRMMSVVVAVIAGCPPIPPKPLAQRTRPSTSLAVSSSQQQSHSNNHTTAPQPDVVSSKSSHATAAGSSISADVAKAPLPLFRRSRWRQSLRDDVSSAVAKPRELPPTPSPAGKATSPMLSYYRRRVAAGDVIVTAADSTATTSMSKSISASGCVAVDGLSSLLSTGSRDTGYASIGTTSPTTGDAVGHATTGTVAAAGVTSLFDVSHLYGMEDYGFDDNDGSGEDDLLDKPRQSVAELRRVFQHSQSVPSHAVDRSKQRTPVGLAPVKGW